VGPESQITKTYKLSLQKSTRDNGAHRQDLAIDLCSASVLPHVATSIQLTVSVPCPHPGGFYIVQNGEAFTRSLLNRSSLTARETATVTVAATAWTEQFLAIFQKKSSSFSSPYLQRSSTGLLAVQLTQSHGVFLFYVFYVRKRPPLGNTVQSVN